MVTIELIPDLEEGGFTARMPDIPAYGEGETEEPPVDWFAQQPPDPQRREKVLAALAPLVWISAGEKYFAAEAYVHWSEKARLPDLIKLLDSPAANQVGFEVCRLLASENDPQLDEVIRQRIGDANWNIAVSGLVTDDPRVTLAVVKALQETTPSEAHLPLIRKLAARGAAEDTSWLRDYAERTPISNRRGNINLYTLLTGLIQKLPKNK